MQVPGTDVTVLDQRLPLRLVKRQPRRRQLWRCCNSSGPAARWASMKLAARPRQRQRGALARRRGSARQQAHGRLPQPRQSRPRQPARPSDRRPPTLGATSLARSRSMVAFVDSPALPLAGDSRLALLQPFRFESATGLLRLLLRETEPGVWASGGCGGRDLRCRRWFGQDVAGLEQRLEVGQDVGPPLADGRQHLAAGLKPLVYNRELD